MNTKQSYSLDNMNLRKGKADDKNENQRLSDSYDIITIADKVSQEHLKLKLQEKGKNNISLENLMTYQKNELLQVNATNSKFISIIAHDLRGPFSSIIGVLEILKHSFRDYNVNEIEKFIDLASDSAARTLNLLDNLLAWAISQNKERSFTPVKINLNELLAYETESFIISAMQKQITLHYSIATDLNVTADLQMVKTILRNLMSNAIKYTTIGGEVMVSALENEPFIEITVRDSGIGISKETQRNLFKIDSFQSTVGTNNERGTGLGLLLCKEFVELHGGNIRLESNPGEGCEFKFTLPHYI